MKIGTLAVVVITFVLLACTSAEAPPLDRTPRFSLCSNLIEEAMVIEAPPTAWGPGYGITISLNDRGKAELSEFSRANLGKEVEIAVDGAVLLRIKLRVVLDSGRGYFSPWASEHAASAMVKTMTTRDDRLPCGRVW